MATIASGLIDSVVSSKVLQAFTDTLASLSAFAIDYNDTDEKTVTIPVIAADTAHNFTAGTTKYSDNAGGTATSIEVSMDKHKYSPVMLNDTQVMNSSKIRLEDLGYQAGGALAKAVLEDILSEVVVANFTRSLTKDSALFDYDSLVDIKSECDTNLAPFNRSLVLGGTYYNALLKDDGIKSRAVIGANVAQSGRLVGLAGFRDILECTCIPSNSENLVGFACNPQALAIGVRYLRPQAGHNYIAARAITDPDTGLTLGLRQFYDEDLAMMYFAYECNYGYETGMDAALVRIVSA